MKSFYLVFLVLYYTSIASEALIINRKCLAVGLMCQNCRTIKLCSRNGTDFSEETIGSCNVFQNETCFMGRCVKGNNPICFRMHLLFHCSDYGYFPDPVNCQRYHNCVANPDEFSSIRITSTPMDCPDTFAYNALTSKCDKKLPKNECHYYPVESCKYVGQTAPLSDNPKMYYLCKSVNYDEIYPVVYNCPSDKVYDGYYGCI